MDKVIDKTSERIFGAATVLLFMFPILPFAAKSIVIGVWAAACLYCVFGRKNKPTVSIKDWRRILIIIFPFLILFSTIIFTDDKNRGWELALRMLPLAIFPLLFTLGRDFLTQKLFNLAKIAFIASTFLVVIYSAGKTYANHEFLDRPLTEIELEYNGVTAETITQEKETEIKYRRMKKYVEEVSNIHSTYLGMLIMLSLYFIGEFLVSKKKKYGLKIAGIVIGLALLAWLAFISVRAPVLGLNVGVLAVLIFKFRNPKYILAALAGFGLLAVLLYTTVPSLKIRMDEVVENKFSLPAKGEDPLAFNSTNVRLGSLYCSMEVFKAHFWTGVGIGDVQPHLDRCYEDKIGAIIYTWDTYNNHNQYLYFADAAGILGLLSFTGMVIFLIVISIKHRDAAGIFFFVSIGLIFLSENVLIRSDGVLYYTAMGYLIFFKKYNSK